MEVGSEDAKAFESASSWKKIISGGIDWKRVILYNDLFMAQISPALSSSSSV
jgi:hypothetical protein